MALDDPNTSLGFTWPPLDWTWAQPAAIAPIPPAPAAELAQPELPPPTAAAPAPLPPPAPAPGPEVGLPATDHFADVFDAQWLASMQGQGQGAAAPPPSPAPPEVDAIAGVDALPPPDSIIQQAAPVVAPRSTAGPGELPLSADERIALAHRDPVAYARLNAQEDSEVADFVRRENAEIQRRDADEAEAAWRDRQTAEKNANDRLAALDVEAQALAAEKPKKFTDSIGNVLSGLAAILLGQLGAPATGGQNAGLQMLMRRMDAFADEQEKDLARRGTAIDRRVNIIGRLRQQGMDAYQARETFRLATLQRARDQLLTEAQKFNHRGTIARDISAAALQAEQQMAQVREAVRRRTLDEGILLAKEAREQQKANDDHLAAQRKLAGVGAGAGGAKQPPEYFEAMGLRRPPIAMTDKEYKGWLANSRAGAELTKAEQEAVAGKSQGMSKEEAERGVAGLKQDDGRPFIAQGTPDQVGEIRKRVAATKTVVRILDQIDRTRTGWSPDITKSAEWKRLKTDWAAAKGVAKDVLGLGALSGPDEALIENYLSGGLDPTGVRDPGPGLLRARQNMLNMTGDSLTTAGYTGPKFDIPKPQLEAVKETPSDARFKKALQAPTNTDVIEATGDKVVGTTSEERNAPFVAPGSAPTLDNVVLPQVRREIDALATAAKDGNLEARAKLEKLLDQAPNAGVKSAVEAALLSLGRDAETFEEATGKQQATARETVPPLPRGTR